MKSACVKLSFEKSVEGRCCTLLPPLDVEDTALPEQFARQSPLRLPQMAETDVSRHYTELAGRTYGVNNGFYPLGSCTMKYNPKLNDEMAELPGFTGIHPLQPASTVQGCLSLLLDAERMLCEVTGMDRMTFQPAAGAHGELTALWMVRAYHEARGDRNRTKIIVPDSAHGTNPASVARAGLQTVNIPSGPDGCVDLEKLRAALGPDTAGLMLTNPNTLGIFDKNILEITELVHQSGGLCYYDGANLNAVMGVARPGDMGFDLVHLNLHKTFSTPHGGGGPGSGPVGCKASLTPFLPAYLPKEEDGILSFDTESKTIGSVRSFYGNFLVVVRAYTYLLSLGGEGLLEASVTAVINANYLKKKLEGHFDTVYDGPCMHEFVLSLRELKKETGVSAMDAAKALLDQGIHPPTVYFPLIVEEAMMLEPTETESRETLDRAAELFLEIEKAAREDPDALHQAPKTTVVGRPDEVEAARRPHLRYSFEERDH